MIADIGKQLKQSVKVFHSRILYLLLPTKEKKYIYLLCQNQKVVNCPETETTMESISLI